MHLLILAICLGIATFSSVPQVKANPVPDFDSDIYSNGFEFIIAQVIGFIVGSSFLVFGAKEEGGRVARIIIFSMIISYVPAFLIWLSAFKSGVLPTLTPVGQALIVTFIPEILGTTLGTIFIKKATEIKWKMALLTMAVLMIASFTAGQLLHLYVDFNEVFHPIY